MKFLFVTGIYPNAIRKLRERFEHEKGSNYASIYRAYTEFSFAGSDRYAHHLNTLGWDTAAVYANDRFIQNAWVREHGTPPGGRNWSLEILCQQIRYFQPEIVLILDLYRFDRPAREEIRARCPSVRWIVGWRSAPVREGEDFSDLDLFLSSLRSLVIAARDRGIRAERLSAGFDEGLADRLKDLNRDLALTFCGSIGPEEGLHDRRRAILKGAFERSPLEIWSDSADGFEGNQTILKKLFRRKRVHPGVYGIEMYGILGRSLSTLNVHIDMAGSEAVNMRLFEATGMGACLITDHAESVKEYFSIDDEVVCFTTADDLVEKISFLVANPKSAIEIGMRGRKRTLGEHSLNVRSVELKEILESRLCRGA